MSLRNRKFKPIRPVSPRPLVPASIYPTAREQPSPPAMGSQTPVDGIAQAPPSLRPTRGETTWIPGEASPLPPMTMGAYGDAIRLVIYIVAGLVALKAAKWLILRLLACGAGLPRRLPCRLARRDTSVLYLDAGRDDSAVRVQLMELPFPEESVTGIQGPEPLFVDASAWCRRRTQVAWTRGSFQVSQGAMVAHIPPPRTIVGHHPDLASIANNGAHWYRLYLAPQKYCSARLIGQLSINGEDAEDQEDCV